MELSGQPASRQQGLYLLKAGQIDEAIDLFTQLEKADPDDPQIHTYLGAAYCRKGDKLHAVWEFEESLRLEESAANYYNLGAMYESLHRIDEAVREYLTAVELDPSHARAVQAVERLKNQYQSEHQSRDEETVGPNGDETQ